MAFFKELSLFPGNGRSLKWTDAYRFRRQLILERVARTKATHPGASGVERLSIDDNEQKCG